MNQEIFPFIYFSQHRPGMGKEELQDERINKMIAERKLRQVW